jgi:hypothetical protein
MARATAGPASAGGRGVSDAGPGRAADALRLAWGAAYDIGFAGDAWHACPLAGDAYLITATTPHELSAAIRADWLARSKP